MVRLWVFLFLVNFGSLAFAESLTAFLSQKTNEIRNWEACQRATSHENQNLASTFKVCLNSNTQKKTFDEISEKIFFESASQKQIEAYGCLENQTGELLKSTEPAVESRRKVLAQDFAVKILKLRKFKEQLEPIEDELEQMKRSEQTSPMGESLVLATVDEVRRKKLQAQQAALKTAVDAISSSFWQSGHETVQKWVHEQIKQKAFDPQKFQSDFLKRGGALDFLLMKIQSQAKQEKESLLKLAGNPKAPPSEFKLSDKDKLRIYRDRNWLAGSKEDKSFEALSCRLEGRYGQGRERFYTTMEVGSAVALTLLPGGFYLAAGRGLIAISAARTLALASGAGIAAGGLASTYEQKCSQSSLHQSAQISCDKESENIVRDLADDNCALDVALAALNFPFPELKASGALIAGVGATMKGLNPLVPKNPQVSVWKALEAGKRVEAKQMEAALQKTLQEEKMVPLSAIDRKQSKSGAFFVRYESGIEGVWKPASGSVADANSEIAVSIIDRHLATNLVPVTVPRKLNGIEGTVQLRVHDLKNEELEAWPDVLGYFDYLIGNSDRHSGNYLVTKEGRLVAIDHGKAFDPKFTFNQQERIEDALGILESIRERKKTLKSQGSSGPQMQNLEKLEQRAQVKAFSLATTLTPPKEVVDQLRRTSRDDWKKMLGPYLNDQKINELYERQKKLLEVIDHTEKTLGPDFYRSQHFSPLVKSPTGN